MPSLLSVVPFFAFACILIGLAIFELRPHTEGKRALSIGTLVWALVPAGVSIFLGVYHLCGLIEEVDEGILFNCSLILFVAGLVVCARGRVLPLLDVLNDAQSQVITVLRDVVLLAASIYMSFVMIELPWNESFSSLPLSSVIFSLVVIAFAMVIAYCFAQRSGVGPALVSTVCFVMGIAQHFVLEFKGAAILPNDILGLGTAAAVSKGYTFILDENCVYAIVLFAVSLCLFAYIRPVAVRRASVSLRERAITVGVHLVLGCSLTGVVLGTFSMTKVIDYLDFGLDRWWPINSYTQRGFLPTFIALLQDLEVPKPENYSTSDAQAREDTYVAKYDEGQGATEERAAAVSQFDSVQPAVIAIMNETFSDLSIFDGLHVGYEGPTALDGFAGTFQRGSLTVSVHGGGTCNSEFEFLTSNSMGFIGTGKMPYVTNDFSSMPTLARQFSELGYKTTAMHPNAPTNWNRAHVYEQMGFDQFLSYDDIAYEGAWGLHAGVADSVTYEKILQLLQEDSSPQFIFDVTMQNHGGYESVDVPEEYLVDSLPDEISDEDLRTATTEYLGLIRASEQELASFLDQLSQINRPVVVVFFGDHQPSFSDAINDLFYPDEDENTHNARLYQTEYVMWSNYEVAGSPQGEASAVSATSVSSLGAELLNRIGAPLTNLQKVRLAAGLDVSCLGINGYMGSDGILYELDAESPYSGVIDDLRRIQYKSFVEGK